jgi:genome maintenance exonuclease 1
MFKHIHHEFPVMLKETAEDGQRLYTTPDGNRYPSVTTILKEHSREGIAKWRKKVGEKEANRISKKASVRGDSVHKVLEKHLRNEDISKANLMPEAKAVFHRMKKVVDLRVSEVHAIEAPLYSHTLRLAGTTDFVGLYDNFLSIVDYKTSLRPKKLAWVSGYFMQGVAYAKMWEEMIGKEIEQIVVLIGIDDTEFCQSFKLLAHEFRPYMNDLISYRDKYEQRLAA